MSLLSPGISGAYGKMSSYCSLSQSGRPIFFFFSFNSSLVTQHLKLSICIASSNFVEIGKQVDKLLGAGKWCKWRSTSLPCLVVKQGYKVSQYAYSDVLMKGCLTWLGCYRGQLLQGAYPRNTRAGTVPLWHYFNGHWSTGVEGEIGGV